MDFFITLCLMIGGGGGREGRELQAGFAADTPRVISDSMGVYLYVAVITL